VAPGQAGPDESCQAEAEERERESEVECGECEDGEKDREDYAERGEG